MALAIEADFAEQAGIATLSNSQRAANLAEPANMQRVTEVPARRQYPEDALDCTDWHDGDWLAWQRLFLGGEPGKQTASEDDLHLACLIVKGRIRDPEKIEALMREAAIARTGPQEKWTRNRQYLSRSIAAALRKVPAKVPEHSGVSKGHTEGPLEVSIAELAKNPDLLTVPADISPWLGKRGLLAMLVGREKLAGKSTLGASDAAQAAHRGHVVLWVDVEQGHHRVVKRFVDLQAPLDSIMTLRRWPQAWEDVETVIARTRPDVIYVDSVASFLMAVEGGVPDASEGERWQALVGRFKRWTTVGKPDAGVVALLHATKADGSYRGSTGIGAAPDLITTMRPDDANPTWRRLETIGRWEVPTRCLRFAGETTGYLDVDAREQAAAKPGAKDLAQLLTHMGGNRWLVSDLAKGIGWSKDKTQNVLNTAREQGMVDREHGGTRGAFVYFTTSTAALTADAPSLLETSGAIGGGADCGTTDIGGDRRSRWSEGDNDPPF